MFRNVKIGEEDVPMVSVASTDLMYKAIFHEDPIALQAKGMDDGEAIDLFMKMGFVMAKYAAEKDRKAMLSLSEIEYMDWLDGFERADYLSALPDIRAVYEGQSATSSTAKKKGGKQSAN